MVNGAKLYKDWHWGVPHAVEMEWEDEDLPRYLIETGAAFRNPLSSFGK